MAKIIISPSFRLNVVLYVEYSMILFELEYPGLRTSLVTNWPNLTIHSGALDIELEMLKRLTKHGRDVLPVA